MSQSKRAREVRESIKREHRPAPSVLVGRNADQPGVTPRVVSVDRALAAGPAVRRVEGRGI